MWLESSPIGQYSSSSSIFIVENGSSPLNYVKYSIRKNEEGYLDLCKAVSNELMIKGKFDMYDKNGSKIYVEDFHHLSDNNCVYIWAKDNEFNYQSLLDMYSVEKNLGTGGYGSVCLLK